MAGKTPAEAVHNFLAPLQRVLACVTDNVLSDGGGYHASPVKHPEHIYALTLYNSPALLGRDKRFALDLIQQYQVISGEGQRGPWKVSTVAYYYTILLAESGQEVLGYHWHPTGHSDVTYPHLHLYAGAGTLQHNLRKAHLPTGRIAIEDVLRLAITHFHVNPFSDNWAEILTATQEAFQEWRTWGGSHPSHV
jgi:hypothetical protein